MINYLTKINQLASIEEADNLLEILRKDYKNNKLSLEETEKIFTEIYKVKESLSKEIITTIDIETDILNEELIANTDKYKLRIEVSNESKRNQGKDKTSYFKVYRQSKSGPNNKCLRISIYTPEYETHRGTDKNLSPKEINSMVDKLEDNYIPTKDSSKTNCIKMMDMIKKELTSKFEKEKVKPEDRKYPDSPTNWQAILYYFMDINNLPMTTVPLTMEIPNYKDLPKE